MGLLTTAAVTCVAMNIYMESRSEPIDGQFAVAQVTVRRAMVDGRLEEAQVCPTVLARKQFSWTTGRDRNGRARFDTEAWTRALAIARRVLLWGYLDHFRDRSEGATHYFAGAWPYWSAGMSPTVIIGSHTFLRED